MINESVFKTYDIRGIYPEELNEELAYLVGKAFATMLNATTVCVGMDARISSPFLKQELVKGLIESGCKVLDLGLVTTPMVSFCVASKKLDGGIMISASHNPGNYNAFKIIAKNARQLSASSGLLNIQTIIKTAAFKKVGETGSSENLDILSEYRKHILSHFDIKKNLKIVFDFGNGVGSVSAIPIIEEFKNLKTVYLYETPDGNFPNHPADPHNIDNLKDLSKKVIEEKADLGVFFDGDADRCYFTDEKGNIILADIVVCMLAENELKNKNYLNKKVYYDLRFTKEIEKTVTKNGGIPVMMRVGNPFYKEKLIDEGGIMAGEFSGHIMYNQNYNIDDGLFACLKVIEILSNSNKSLSQLLSKYYTFSASPEISISVEGKNMDKIIENIKQKYSDGTNIELDGVYIKYPNWWFNLRKSNTEPVVRLRIEANNKKTLEIHRQELLDIINL